MDSFGDTIRKLREEKELPLRTVAAFLDIDQAILSKIERAQRKPTREQVVKLAEYFKVKENDLLVAWLSDKWAYEVEDEDMALKALQVAEEKVNYITKPTISKSSRPLLRFRSILSIIICSSLSSIKSNSLIRSIIPFDLF